MAGHDANINHLVKRYFQENGVTPNRFNYQRANLQLQVESWTNNTPVTTQQGLTRSVAVEDQAASSGNVSVTLNQAVLSVRVHLTAGRFVAGQEKLVQLRLPQENVFENFEVMEFDASKEKSEVIQKTTPVKLVDKDLSSFKGKTVKVESSTKMFEGTFVANAVLKGTVVTDIGQVETRTIVQHFGRNLPQPFSESYDGSSLVWKVQGIAEFVLDSQARVS